MASTTPRYSFFNENAGELIKEHRLYYLLVNAVSKRVRQLQLGDRALALPSDGTRDVVAIALQEFAEDKLDIIPRALVYDEHFKPEESDND